MAVQALKDSPRDVPEQRLILNCVSWKEYERLSAALGDRPGLRMIYLEGTLEIMTPSFGHEADKTIIARLLEIYALEKGIDLNGYGSMTFRRKAKARGLEPDECYCIGPMRRRTPDIALEVIATSGGIDKLAVYAGLGVPEVWFWQDGRFRLYRLSGEAYAPVKRSQFFPGLDFSLLARFVDRENQTQAIRKFRDVIK